MTIFLFGFLLFVVRSKKLSSFAVVPSALIIGGGLSNLVDRIINQGAVIDFLNVGIGSLRTGILNLADMAIMVGMFIFVVCKRENAKFN